MERYFSPDACYSSATKDSSWERECRTSLSSTEKQQLPPPSHPGQGILRRIRHPGPVLEGGSSPASNLEAEGCTLVDLPLPEASLHSSLSALAESLETLLPTCTPELSELFKDTRIFLLHSHVTWLANAGWFAAAVAPTTLAAAWDWATMGWHPQSWFLALQWGLVAGTRPSGTSDSREARCCAVAAPPLHADTVCWGCCWWETGHSLCYR